MARHSLQRPVGSMSCHPKLFRDIWREEALRCLAQFLMQEENKGKTFSVHLDMPTCSRNGYFNQLERHKNKQALVPPRTPLPFPSAPSL